MKRTRTARLALTTCLAASLLLPVSPAGAEQAALARADLDGDGRDEAVELRPGGEDGAVLVVNGRETEARARSTDLRAGAAELRPIDLGGGRRAGVFRVPLAREGLAFEAILLVRRGEIVPVWFGVTGPRGDRGSRWGERIIVEDLTGDGHPNILVASIADEVPLCGVNEPELFPRALDPASGRLRPVMLNRLRGLELEAVPITASRQSPGPLADAPAIEVPTWAVASTQLGDRGVVEGLSAPRALADRDPSTSWVEGRPGPGTGEFVTARLLPGPYRIQALALTLAPRPGDGERGGDLGRPRTLTLLLDGPEGPRRYLVEIPDDPSAYPGEPVWVSLPEPVRASCLSLVLGEVHGGRRAPSDTAVAEVAVYTDLDFEGGAERLIQAFAEETANAEVLIRALGSRAIPILSERWDELDPSVRRRAARVLADLGDSAAAALLALAALGPDERAAIEGRRGLLALADEALEALGEHLDDEEADRRAAAALLVGEIGTVTAVQRLLARMGEAPDEDHSVLRRALRAALESAGEPGREAVLSSAEAADGSARYALLSSLVPIEPGERERFARLVEASWEAAETFEARYRTLSLAAGGGPSERLRALAGAVLREAEDRYLRAHAAKALGGMGDHASTLTHLSRAARDEWTGVRLAAARALGRAAPDQGRATLTRLLRDDAWPAVRAAAAESLARGSAEAASPPLIAALSDPSPLVQVTAARLLGGLDRPEALAPLRLLAEDDEAPVEARAAAARAIGSLCTGEARAALIELVRRGRERRATPARARVAAAALVALVPYRGDEVDALLAEAAQRGVPGLRLAAIGALGQRGGERAGEVLEALGEGDLPWIRAAVGSALRQLEGPPLEPRCPR